MTAKRRNPRKSVDETLKGAARLIRGVGRRVGAEADEVDLSILVGIRGDVETAIESAVAGLRAQGHSWDYIAQGLGTSRQYAHRRYGAAERATVAAEAS